MDLDHYLDTHNIADAAFAQKIGVKPFAVYRYRNRKRIPHPDIMPKIVIATNGQVQPQDFYDLPPPTSLPAAHQPHA